MYLVKITAGTIIDISVSIMGIIIISWF